jgi:hypothetical protein
MFLPAPLKKVSILIERIPWIAAQYVRAANHVPTGCDAGLDINARSGAETVKNLGSARESTTRF